MQSKKSIFGIQPTCFSLNELADIIAGSSIEAGGGSRLVFTANLDHIINLDRIAEFKDAYNNAWVVTIDGAPVFWYAHLKGLRNVSKITGSDLLPAVLARLSSKKHRLFFVANSSTTVQQLKKKLSLCGFEMDAIESEIPPFGFENCREYGIALAAKIKEHGTTHLFMGIGAPKSEIWVHSHRNSIGSCYVMSVGAALEFTAGLRRRAPKWMQKLGLEWMWRLSLEPRRLYRRYLINSWRFIAAIRNDLQK